MTTERNVMRYILISIETTHIAMRIICVSGSYGMATIEKTKNINVLGIKI